MRSPSSQQRARRAQALALAPVRQVRELPPPQRLVDPAGLVVPQAVHQVGDDVGEVVGEPDRGSGRPAASGRRRRRTRRSPRAGSPGSRAAGRRRGPARRRARTARSGTTSPIAPSRRRPASIVRRAARSSAGIDRSPGLSPPATSVTPLDEGLRRASATSAAKLGDASVAPVPLVSVRCRRSVSDIEQPPSLERAPQGDLVGVLEVAADRQSDWPAG